MHKFNDFQNKTDVAINKYDRIGYFVKSNKQ